MLCALIMKHLFLCSTDSILYHPSNKSWDFTVELPHAIEGQWKCALGDISYNTTENLYVFCDLCEQSYIRGGTLPILRYVTQPKEFTNLYYFNVNLSHIKRVRIFIRNNNMEIPSDDIGPVRCTLILKPIK